MRTHLISYDLGVPETSADYKRLIDHIKSIGSTWATPLKSQWLVVSSQTTAQIRDEITPLVDSNDKILVIEVTDDDWSSRNLPKEVTDWMTANM